MSSDVPVVPYFFSQVMVVAEVHPPSSHSATSVRLSHDVSHSAPAEPPLLSNDIVVLDNNNHNHVSLVSSDTADYSSEALLREAWASPSGASASSTVTHSKMPLQSMYSSVLDIGEGEEPSFLAAGSSSLPPPLLSWLTHKECQKCRTPLPHRCNKC